MVKKSHKLIIFPNYKQLYVNLKFKNIIKFIDKDFLNMSDHKIKLLVICYKGNFFLLMMLNNRYNLINKIKLQLGNMLG